VPTPPPAPGSLPVSVPVPGNSFHIDEDVGPGAIGNYANQHIGWFSTDGGNSRFHSNYMQSFQMDFTVNITAPNGQPRKEGGIKIRNPRLNNQNPPGNPAPFTDEGEVMVASDGQVTVGQTSTVSFRYFAPGVQDPVLGAYQLLFTDPVTGAHDSGIKLWGNEADGTFGFNTDSEFGFLMQAQRNPFISDNYTVEYNGLQVVPAPGALALIGFAGLAAGRRRR
jgi:hypothetical protein